MPLATASAIVSGGLAAYQLFEGISGRIQADEDIARLGDRPQAQVPAALTEATDISRRQAQQGLPAATQELFQQGAERAATTSLAAAQTRRGGLIGVGTTGQQLQDANLQIASMDAQARLAAQQGYQQNLIRTAEEQRRVEQENVLGAYDYQRQLLEADRFASQQNINAALQTGANVAGLAATQTPIPGSQLNTGTTMPVPTATPQSNMNLATSYIPPTGGSGISYAGLPSTRQRGLYIN